MTQGKRSSSQLEQLEAEMVLILADQSLPMAKRNELESRLAAIRVKAGTPKPEPAPTLGDIRDEVDELADTEQCVEERRRKLRRTELEQRLEALRVTVGIDKPQ